MANRWIQFVKDFANKKNISYASAIKNSECKKMYQQKIKGGRLPNRRPPTPAGGRRRTREEMEEVEEGVDVNLEFWNSFVAEIEASLEPYDWRSIIFNLERLRTWLSSLPANILEEYRNLIEDALETIGERTEARDGEMQIIREMHLIRNLLR